MESSQRRKSLREINRDNTQRVVLETQGHVVKTRVAGRKPPNPPDDEHKRGKVYGLSYASRKRLIEKFARMEPRPIDGHRHVATFVTLTYPGAEKNLPSPQEAKAHLRAFLERLRRRWPECGGVWRMQFESSGKRAYHPHFHLVLFNLPFIDKRVIQTWWREVIQCDWERPFTRIESIRSWRGVMSYASNYVSVAGGGVHHDSYPHAGVDENTGEIVGDVDMETGLVHTGRVWGVFNRGALPMAELVEYIFALGEWFYDLKRSARRVWGGINDHAWAGWTLFVENPERWVELARFYMGEVRQ